MTLWLTILGAGLITYLIRLSLIMLLDRVRVTAVVKRALQFVPPAVLSAIIFPEMLQPSGEFDLSLGNFLLLAGLVGILAARRTKNVLWTIGAGMSVLWLLQAWGYN